eukprot:m.308524 g.308524  ORF g.308524 m.308524 type:complete len:295 (+) comp15940_c1_seq2:96-980(+)
MSSSKDTDLEDGESQQHYAALWDKIYSRESQREQDGTLARREWHCTFDELAPVLASYLPLQDPTALAPLTACDLGCGSSDLSQRLYELGLCHIVMVDIAPQLLLDMSARAPWAYFLMADARCLPVQSKVFNVIFDKGTLDALGSDAERKVMVDEALRCLSPTGVFVSISFLSPRRLQFMNEIVGVLSKTVGIAAHYHILGSDPRAAGEARLMVVLAQAAVLASFEYTTTSLTRQILERIRLTGSVMADDAEVDKQRMLQSQQVPQAAQDQVQSGQDVADPDNLPNLDDIFTKDL